MIKKKLGEILVDAGLVSDSAIQEALTNKRDNQKIGDYLVEKGFVREEIMYEKLSMQMQIPLFKLSDIDMKQNALDIVTKDLLNKYTAFPVELTGSLLTIAMENPLDEVALKEFEDKLQLDITGVFGIKSEILDYISKYYDIDDSMVEIFGIHEESGTDRNELQIADKFFSNLKENGKFNIVITETRGRLFIKMGEVSFLAKKDTKYLLDFIKKVVVYDEKNSDFNVLFNQEESKIKISMFVKRSKSQTEYWIDSFLLNTEEDFEDLGLVGNENLAPGIHVILNENFKNTTKFKKQLSTLKSNKNISMLVNTKDITYEKYNLNVLESDYMELIDYVNFADVFVLDYGWEISEISPLLRLLREDKVVYLHTPFSDEEQFKKYLNKIGVYDIVHRFIKNYKSI